MEPDICAATSATSSAGSLRTEPLLPAMAEPLGATSGFSQPGRALGRRSCFFCSATCFAISCAHVDSGRVEDVN